MNISFTDITTIIHIIFIIIHTDYIYTYIHIHKYMYIILLLLLWYIIITYNYDIFDSLIYDFSMLFSTYILMYITYITYCYYLTYLCGSITHPFRFVCIHMLSILFIHQYVIYLCYYQYYYYHLCFRMLENIPEWNIISNAVFLPFLGILNYVIGCQWNTR